MSDQSGKKEIISCANAFWNAGISFTSPLTTGFACFFVLGYLLGEIPLSHNRILLSAALWGIGMLITILGPMFAPAARVNLTASFTILSV